MNYRSVLETLKFLPGEQVALQLSTASTVWQRAAFSDELWWHYCTDIQVGEEYLSMYCSPLEAYRSLKTNNFLVCWKREEGAVLWYDCANRSVEKVIRCPEPHLIQTDALCAILSDLSLVICGSGRRVIRITRSGKIVELPRMRVQRSDFGLVYFLGSLYAFGGMRSNEELSSAEALAVTGARWLSIGSMQVSRASFTPCGFNRSLYLCGGTATLCERFDTESHAFYPLKIALRSPGPTVSILSPSALVLIQSTQVTYISISSWTVDRERPLKSRRVNRVLRPVLVKGRLYCCSGKLDTVNTYENLDLDWEREVCIGIPSNRIKYKYDSKFNVEKVIVFDT